MELMFLGYSVLDDGIFLSFEVLNNLKLDSAQIVLSDAELDAVSTPAQLRALIITKLKRKVNREGIANKLDQFKGQTITI